MKNGKKIDGKMNNEQYNQIIDETYKKYQLETWGECDKKWLIELDGMNMRTGEKCKVHRQLSKEEFVNKCKIDEEFSDKWELKIEERELSSIERMEYYGKHYMKENESMSIDDLVKVDYEKLNIPTKLITIKYRDKTIEVYE